jgi:hypothetical protein
VLPDKTFSDERGGDWAKRSGFGMNRGGTVRRRFLFLLLVLSFGAYTGCGTLNPQHLKNGKSGENYQYFLSKDIELRFDFTGGEFAFRPRREDSRITIIEQSGIIDLNGVVPADFSDIISIPQSQPGILRTKDSYNKPVANSVRIVRSAAFSDAKGSSARADLMVIHIVFGDNNDDFLEFAAYNYEPKPKFWEWLWDEEKYKDKKFYLIFDQEQQAGQKRQDGDPQSSNYITYKGRKYSVRYEGEDRPYLMYSIPEKNRR